jgi:hypothetical protein
MINPEKLNRELIEAGIEFSGCNEKGVVWDIDGKTEIQEQKKVRGVLSKHDPTPVPAETLEEKIEKILQEKIKSITASEGK